MTVVFRNSSEIAELDRQLPQTKSNGGWQSLMVTLAQSVDRTLGPTLDGEVAKKAA